MASEKKREQLWAPWRLSYVAGEEDTAPATNSTRSDRDNMCFFCRDSVSSDDRKNLVIHRGQHTIAILNRYPYNNGHLLIAPQAHKSRLDELTADEHRECFEMIPKMVLLLEQLISAEGFNIGLNLGVVAGAGIPGHLHWHIVPRWNGDTNFMPAVADIKVIPQSLDAAWEMLTAALASEG